MKKYKIGLFALAVLFVIGSAFTSKQDPVYYWFNMDDTYQNSQTTVAGEITRINNPGSNISSSCINGIEFERGFVQKDGSDPVYPIAVRLCSNPPLRVSNKRKKE